MDKTFNKGLAVIEALSRCDKPCGITQLAAQLKLTKSNVHRLLQTLAAGGYVRNVGDTGSYELTLKLWELGSKVRSRLDIADVSGPFLKVLGDKTSEAVHLSVLSGAEVIYIDKVESPKPIRAYSMIGGRAPAYCVATGKAMLAFSSSKQLDELRSPLTRHSVNTITARAKLDRELQQVRELGYAINRGEWREDVWGVGAPIFDQTGNVIAAVGISGPSSRLKLTVLKRYAPLVMNAAKQISKQLGYMK
jgi:DNA-binding IclR family transcriptional regulator